MTVIFEKEPVSNMYATPEDDPLVVLILFAAIAGFLWLLIWAATKSLKKQWQERKLLAADRAQSAKIKSHREIIEAAQKARESDGWILNRPDLLARSRFEAISLPPNDSPKELLKYLDTAAPLLFQAHNGVETDAFNELKIMVFNLYDKPLSFIQKAIKEVDSFTNEIFDPGCCPTCRTKSWQLTSVYHEKQFVFASALCAIGHKYLFKSTRRFPSNIEIPELKKVVDILSQMDQLNSETPHWFHLRFSWTGGDHIGNREARRRGTIPATIQTEVYQRDKGVCVNCGSRESLQFDHIIPFSKGGGDQIENLRLLCRKCNLSKGASFGERIEL